MENKGVSIYSIDAERNKMTIHLDEIKKVCDEKKSLEDRIAKAIEYIEKECSDLLIGYFHNRFDSTQYYEKIIKILKGDKE